MFLFSSEQFYKKWIINWAKSWKKILFHVIIADFWCSSIYLCSYFLLFFFPWLPMIPFNVAEYSYDYFVSCDFSDISKQTNPDNFLSLFVDIYIYLLLVFQKGGLPSGCQARTGEQVFIPSIPLGKGISMGDKFAHAWSQKCFTNPFIEPHQHFTMVYRD